MNATEIIKGIEAEQMKETVVMDRTDVRTTIFLLLFVPWKTAE